MTCREASATVAAVVFFMCVVVVGGMAAGDSGSRGTAEGCAVVVKSLVDYMVQVNSRTPDSNVWIDVSRADTGGQASGLTPFSRIYADGERVILTSTGIYGVSILDHWEVNGEVLRIGADTLLVVTQHLTIVAVYVETNIWPSLKVLNQGTLVPDGSVVPFGMTSNAVPLSATFTLTNEGAVALTLTGAPPIAVTGVYADAFTVMGLPGTTIGPGEAVSFTIRFDQPYLSNNGATSVDVQIPNAPSSLNGPNPYTFRITAAWINARPLGPAVLWASDGSSTDRVDLTWEPDPYASSYMIQRRADGDDWPEPLSDGIAGTNYTDTSALSGVRYVYKIWSENTYGYSKEGPTDPGFARLCVPTGLVASENASTNWIDLWWSPVERATSYNIYRGIPEAKAYQLVGSSPSNGYHDVFSKESAQPGVVYSYMVSASNHVCESALSEPTNGYGGLMATVVIASDGSYTGYVNVAWIPVWGANSYRVYRHTTPAFDLASNIANVVTTYYNDAAVIEGTTYYYWVESVSGPSIMLSDSDTGFVVHVAGHAPDATWVIKKLGNRQTLHGKNIPDVLEAYLSNNWQIGISSYNPASDSCQNFFGPLTLTLKKMKLKNGVPVRWWWKTKIDQVITFNINCQFGKYSGVERWKREVKIHVVPSALGGIPEPCILWMIPPGSPVPAKARMTAEGVVPDEFVGFILRPMEPAGAEDVQYLVPELIDTRTLQPDDSPEAGE